MDNKIIHIITYDNSGNFLTPKCYIFTKKIILIFKGLFIDETNPRVSIYTRPQRKR
jgi:hypothetical protein